MNTPTAKMTFAGLIPLDANVEMVHLDANGNRKAIFQENALCIKLMKAGKLSPHWINQWYAPIISPFLGHWSDHKDTRNLITNAGKAAVASRINGAGSEALFDKIGWGTGATAANVADTTLQTEVNLSGGAASGVHVISSATASRVTTTVTNDTAQNVGTATASGTIAITESGQFNAATNGVLLCRQVFSAVNVVSGDSIQFTWKVAAA
jgi:hypothetical protein